MKTTDHTYIVTVGIPDRCVIFGHCDKPVKPGDMPTLTGARMVLYWPAECNGLFGLAAGGPKKGSRLTPAVECAPGEVVRTISVPPAAAEAFDAWK